MVFIFVAATAFARASAAHKQRHKSHDYDSDSRSTDEYVKRIKHVAHDLFIEPAKEHTECVDGKKNDNGAYFKLSQQHNCLSERAHDFLPPQ